MKYGTLALIILLFTQCKMPGSLIHGSSTDRIPEVFVYDTIPPILPMASTHSGILIVDLGQAYQPGLLFNKKRDEVVERVYQNFIADLQFALQFQVSNSVVIDTTLKKDFTPEQLYQLMDRCQAEYGLVIPRFESGFNQDEIVREDNGDGSVSKTAYYSVYNHLHLDVYRHSQIELMRDFGHSRQHSSRSVLSGLFARGPSFQKNEKSLQEVASANLNDIVDLFKPKIIRRVVDKNKLEMQTD